MPVASWGIFFLGLVISPLLPGVVNKTKAFFAGRSGPPLLQVYRDLWKLSKKGAVYSRTTTWIFYTGPVIGLASVSAALAMLPFAGVRPLLSFPGDIFLFAYLLAAGRFFSIAAALDTGSSFEGMGASRESQFSVFTEPALLLAVAALAFETKALSISEILRPLPAVRWPDAGAVCLLSAAALLIVFLAENARIPVDDPNTHLELTMIHEVMALDHSGPDYALIVYAEALKFWTLGALTAGAAAAPFHVADGRLALAIGLAAMFGLAVIVGIVESSMARLRLSRVPHLLAGAGTAAVLALALAMR